MRFTACPTGLAKGDDLLQLQTQVSANDDGGSGQVSVLMDINDRIQSSGQYLNGHMHTPLSFIWMVESKFHSPHCTSPGVTVMNK